MQRELNQYSKPQNPMSPYNNTWDYTLEERIKILEQRVEDLQINILDVFKAVLGEIEEEKKEAKEAKETEEEKETQ